MTPTLAFAPPAAFDCDLLALFVHEGAVAKGKLADARLSDFDGALAGLVRRVAAEEEFSGKEGQQLSLHTHGKTGPARLLVLGLGKRREPERLFESLRVAAARAVKAARAAGAARLGLSWPGDEDDAALAREAQAVAEGTALGLYRFDKYLREKKPLKLASVQLLVRKGAAGVAEAVKLGDSVAQATCLARDLVNEPAGVITPQALAAEARRVAREGGLKIEVLGRAQIEKLGMRLFLGVAQGSAQEPQLVRMSYEPAKARGQPVALVGKAITFDSGGLSIKTAGGMETMKCDMAGAAAVIAAMQLVAQQKPPFPVRGYFGACENLPGGTAYKPGDVITGRSGTSVEILNTDAEGRLVLADVLAWAVEERPAAVIDLATLTGAIMVALGPWTSGLFCNDEALADEVLAAARTAGEAVWRMPLPPEMEELIKSPIADLKNTSGRHGGAIGAALFLQHFTQPRASEAPPRKADSDARKPGAAAQTAAKIPWAHLDIAGPAFLDKERGYHARGGTGAGVRLLAEWLRRRR